MDPYGLKPRNNGGRTWGGYGGGRNGSVTAPKFPPLGTPANIPIRPPRESQQRKGFNNIRNQFNELPGILNLRIDKTGSPDYRLDVPNPIKDLFDDINDRYRDEITDGGQCS